MKKAHLLPNFVTAFGLSCGLFVIFKTNMAPVGGVDAQMLVATAGILLLAVVADLLDGAIARAMKAESQFGGLFDSLADGITFGVSPSVIVLKSLSIPSGSNLSFFLTLSAMLFSVCGVLRLVRFSSMAKPATDEEALDIKKTFTGLPIPAGAAAVVSLNLLLASEELQSVVALSDGVRAWILFFAMTILGYFMVSRWKFPSLKTLHIRVASFRMVFISVFAAVVTFYGIIHYFPVVFFAVTWLYIVIAWILSLARLISGKKSKTLVEFEPDPDDFDFE